MKREERNINFSAVEKLDLSKYKVGQYLILINGEIVKKGFTIDKLVKTVHREYPDKIPFIFRIQPIDPSIS